jgi:tRNA threonylcarbamoyladenosine biosynthesis protein TsaB
VIVMAVDATERTRMEWALVDLQGDDSTGAVLPARNLEVQLPELLNQGSASSAQALVVVTGPGSLTGIRIAVAASLGAGMARGIPVYGVGSLEVVAFAVPSGEVVAVRPAGRGGLWVGRYRHHDGLLEQLEPPVRMDEGTWRSADGVAVARIPEPSSPGSALPRGAPRPLALAARFALTRTPLDVDVVDPATGRQIDSRL